MPSNHQSSSSFFIPFSSCPQFFPAPGSFPVRWLFPSGGQRIGALASALVLPMNIQDVFLQHWLIWSPCYPRDSQASSPAPQFKSINSSMLSLLFFPINYFNWRIIISQYCDGFCHTSAWIGHSYTCVPPILNPPSTCLPTLFWVVPEHWLWVPCFMHQTCTGHLFYIW